MITKKICLLGSVCVGKTSLVRRFVYSCFSDDYESTIGVKLHKKSLQLDSNDLNLIVWDIQGEDRYDKVLVSFLKGLSGFMLVVDVTQPESAQVAIELRERVESNFGSLPHVVVYSKCDLVPDDGIAGLKESLESKACGVLRTSSFTGEGVEEAFSSIARSMLSA